MSVFGNLYSQYYDLLYQAKDYAAEVNYVNKLIKNHSNGSNKILDLGCGTGRHDALLCDEGFKVHGIDISQEMLVRAVDRIKGREDKLTFSQSDITKLRLSQKFDVVISLFHVMSYQVSNAALDKVFSGVISHLEKGGLFIFDFWYGPAVLTDLPKVKVKKLENEHIKITRITESNLNSQLNTVDVEFDVLLTDKESGRSIENKEIHTMRYFFDPELELLCEKHGFDIEAKYQWLSDSEPGFGSWNVVWVLKGKSFK
jgi:SAM-dependent methyltransferase